MLPYYCPRLQSLIKPQDWNKDIHLSLKYNLNIETAAIKLTKYFTHNHIIHTHAQFFLFLELFFSEFIVKTSSIYRTKTDFSTLLKLNTVACRTGEAWCESLFDQGHVFRKKF